MPDPGGGAACVDGRLPSAKPRNVMA